MTIIIQRQRKRHETFAVASILSFILSFCLNLVRFTVYLSDSSIRTGNRISSENAATFYFKCPTARYSLVYDSSFLAAADTIRILVATDNHVGYAERDPVRGNDSYTTFNEIMELAKERDVL